MRPGHYVVRSLKSGESFVEYGHDLHTCWVGEEALNGFEIVCGPLEDLPGWPDLADGSKALEETIESMTTVATNALKQNEALAADLKEWYNKECPVTLSIGNILRKHGVIEHLHCSRNCIEELQDRVNELEEDLNAAKGEGD